MKTFKEKMKNNFKVGTCKVFWNVFILQSLYIIYMIAPSPLEPMITISSDFAKITGPNIIKEGEVSGDYRIEVSKDLRQDLEFTLHYTGTAEAGKDFIEVKKVLIKKGEFFTNFKIQTLDDPLQEVNEAFAVKIASINGNSFMQEYNISEAGGLVFTKILDEKSPKNKDKDSVGIAITGAFDIYEDVNESIYKITLSKKAIEDIDLRLSYSGTAIFGKDYTASKELKIKKGSRSTSVKLHIIDDVLKEGSESIIINIEGLDDIGFEDIRYESSKLHINLMDEKKPSKDIIVRLNAAEKVNEDSKIVYTLQTQEKVLDDIKLEFDVVSTDIAQYDKTIKSQINKGSSNASFEIILVDDNVKETKQHIDLTLSAISSTVYESVRLDKKSIRTILVDEPVQLNEQSAEISLISVKERYAENENKVELLVKSSQVLEKDLVIDLDYKGSAKDKKDYKAVKSIIIKKGSTETKFTLALIDDNLLEGTESIHIKIKKLSGGGLESYKLSKPIEITIVDENVSELSDNQTVFVFIEGKRKVTENNKKVNYKISLSKPAIKDTPIGLSFSGEAMMGKDYRAKKNFIIKKGDKSVNFELHILNDKIKEGSETLKISINKVANSGYEDIRAKEVFVLDVLDEKKSLIQSDNQSVLLYLSAAKKVKEGKSLEYTLRLSEPALEDMKIELQLQSNDLESYQKTISVVIKKGDKETVFELEVQNDNVIEKDSYLSLSIASNTDAGFENIKRKRSKVKTIIIDEKNSADTIGAHLDIVSLDGHDITENTKQIRLMIKSSQKVEKDLKIKLSYSGEAKRGIDFKAKKNLVIKKGHKEAGFIIEIINDNFLEGSESLIIGIEEISGGGLEVLTRSEPLTLAIRDEDVSLNKQIAYVSLEGPSRISEPHTSKNYKIEVSQKLEEDLMVEISYKGSTASIDTDFIPITKVKISKGQKYKSFKLKTLDDNEIEVAEDIHLSLHSLSGGGLEGLIIDKAKASVITSLTDEIDISNAFETIISKKKVSFESASTELSESSHHALQAIAKLLLEFPKAKLTIEGHTNSIGSAQKNLALSNERAHSVRHYLMEQGITEDRMHSIGYGESRPRVPSSHANAKALNKRVEFKVKY